MISCNYYPKVEAFQNNKIEQRLSSHKDVSLFSIFPYGLAEGLASKDESGKVLEIGNQQDCFGFNGYGLEYFTKDEFKAFNHFVELPKNQKKERFSVAYFSIPKPNAIFTLNGKTYHAETFYQDYLNLF